MVRQCKLIFSMTAAEIYTIALTDFNICQRDFLNGIIIHLDRTGRAERPPFVSIRPLW